MQQGNESPKERKHVSLGLAIDRLSRSVSGLIHLIDEMDGGPSVLEDKKPEGATHPFQAVYDTAAARIVEESERIHKFIEVISTRLFG